MQVYNCPTCGASMERDLMLFMDHTDKHIVDEIKKLHPKWITPDGYCPKCLDYFKRAMRNPETVGAAEESEASNIDAQGVRQRFILGIVGVVAGVALGLWFKSMGAARVTMLFLFPIFFAAALGFFQARKKLCVVIAQKQEAAMRRRASRILWVAALVAALVTMASVLIEW